MPTPPLTPDQIQHYTHQLESAAKDFGLSINPEQNEQLLAYLQLFAKWNRSYNLSAVRDTDTMLARHVIDSLSIAPYLKGERFIDVGTGGGLPGMVLAILFPERQFTLLDSNGKKTRFLFQVKTELKLNNVTVENNRVEKYQPESGFDGVISRAFATILDMVTGAEHLLGDEGVFLAMKGVYPSDELSALPKHYKVETCHRLDYPGADGERHLAIISKSRRV